MSCAYTLDVRKLRVTSPQLIILAGREKAVGYWLPFRSFWNYGLTQVNRFGGNARLIYLLLKVWKFPFISIPLELVWSPSNLLYRANFFPSSWLSEVRHDLWSLGMPIIAWRDDSDALTTRAKKLCPARLSEKVTFPNPTSKSFPYSENPSRPIIPLSV